MTGAIPAALGNLTNLEWLGLSSNELTGRIPAELGRLVNLEYLSLGWNELTGAIPAALGNLTDLEVLRLSSNELTGSTTWLENLTNLEWLNLFGNWGVTGALPASLEVSSLETLDIFFTQTCAPAGWRGWLKTIEFDGRLCGVERVTIDVAVVYTPAASEEAGGTAAIEALIDLWIAETNGAYDASGVHQRLALAAREEVDYVESGDSLVDIERLSEPSDGHLDSVHDLRDQAGADLVHLVLAETEPDIGGRGQRPGAFSFCIVTYPTSGCFAHELGHNMALRHERYEQSFKRDWGGGVLTPDPAYGYVNQRALGAGAPTSSRWRTIMAYGTQCEDADLRCNELLRFSNPRQRYDGDPLGVPQEPANRGVDGPADAVAVLNATGPAAALWRDRPAAANRPPEPVGALPSLRIGLNEGTATVNLSGAFRDPDGDPLTYGASSSGRAGGGGIGVGQPGGGDPGVGRRRDDPGDGDRPRRPERRAYLHGHGRQPGDEVLHRSPARTWRDADQGRPLQGAARAYRRLAGSGRTGAVRLDGSGHHRGRDAGQARAPAGDAGGAGRGVCGDGPGRAPLDGYGPHWRGDADPGGAPDGVARGGGRAGVNQFGCCVGAREQKGCGHHRDGR